MEQRAKNPRDHLYLSASHKTLLIMCHHTLCAISGAPVCPYLGSTLSGSGSGTYSIYIRHVLAPAGHSLKTSMYLLFSFIALQSMIIHKSKKCKHFLFYYLYSTPSTISVSSSFSFVTPPHSRNAVVSPFSNELACPNLPPR